MIDLTQEIRDFRQTRTVLGAPPSIDVSAIFEEGRCDFLTGEPITDQNFDQDTVIEIRDLGLTRRKSLLDIGVVAIKVEHLFNKIDSNQLIYEK